MFHNKIENSKERGKTPFSSNMRLFSFQSQDLDPVHVFHSVKLLL